jgi:uracil-DNA glycosylase
MDSLLRKIRMCELCNSALPLKPKPILNFSKAARIMIIGQAPGIKAHDSGKPWNDASGVRLREWLGVSDEQFYDKFILPLCQWGFVILAKASLVIYHRAQNVPQSGWNQFSST